MAFQEEQERPEMTHMLIRVTMRETPSTITWCSKKTLTRFYTAECLWLSSFQKHKTCKLLFFINYLVWKFLNSKKEQTEKNRQKLPVCIQKKKKAVSDMDFLPTQTRHWLVIPTSSEPLLPQEGQVIGRKFCGWVDVSTHHWKSFRIIEDNLF